MLATRALFEVTEQTEKAASALRLASPGDLVAWGELSLAIGFDAQGEGHGHVTAARRILEREGYVFRPVNTVGLYRLTKAEVAEQVGRQRTRKACSQARRGLRELATLSSSDLASLTPQQRRDFALGQLMLTSLRDNSSGHAIRREEKRIAGCKIPQIDPADFA